MNDTTDTTVTDTAPAATLAQLARRAAAEARTKAHAKILTAAFRLAERVLGAEAAAGLVWAVNADAPDDGAGEHAAAADIAHPAATLLYYPPEHPITMGRLELMLYCGTCRRTEQHPIKDLADLGRHLRAAVTADGGAR